MLEPLQNHRWHGVGISWWRAEEACFARQSHSGCPDGNGHKTLSQCLQTHRDSASHFHRTSTASSLQLCSTVPIQDTTTTTPITTITTRANLTKITIWQKKNTIFTSKLHSLVKEQWTEIHSSQHPKPQIRSYPYCYNQFTTIKNQSWWNHICNSKS